MKAHHLYYLGVLVIGLSIGWLLFGSKTSETKAHEHAKASSSSPIWTCSMHPQIAQPEAGDCPICGMDLIPAELGTDGLGADEFKLTENAMRLANIQTTVASLVSDSKSSVGLSGKIVENEKTNAIQVSYFSGRIEKLFINFTGENITKGQLLATIYSPELFAAQQELLTTFQFKKSHPDLYQSVRNKLSLWKLSDAQIESIETSGKPIENFPVYATISGTITEKMIEIGQSVKQGQALFKIADLQSVWAVFDVYENQVGLVEVDQDIEVNATHRPKDPISSKVAFIDPVLNAKTRTLRARVELKNVRGDLKPGMFVKGTLTTIHGGDVLVVPSSAVLWTGKRSIVYVKTRQNEPVFTLREIKIGAMIGSAYQVLEGLKDGEEVVTNGAFTVDATAQLQGKKSMMNGAKNKVPSETIPPAHHPSQRTGNRIKVDAKFQKQLKTAFDAYTALKNALVEGNAEKSSETSSAMLRSLNKIDKTLLKDAAYNTWEALYKILKKDLDALNATTILSVQRSHLKPLSSHLITAIETFGINLEVYHQFCPMADNDSGGSWLSTEKTIINPYFGAAMLNCGEIIKTIE